MLQFTLDSDVTILAWFLAQMAEINLLTQIGTETSHRITDISNNIWS